MKNLKFLTGLILVALFSQMLKAQDCTTYFPVKKGATLETTNYDKKGKVTAISRFQVLETKNTADGLQIRAKSEIEIPDNSKDAAVNDTTLTHELVFYCKNGEFYMDMKEFLNSLHLDQYEGMNMEVSSKDMALPANPKPGDVLNDGNLTVVVRKNDVKLITIVMDITNRKVEALEKLTVPAGTFDCVKISYNITSKFGFMKSMGSSNIWYAKGVGTVKSENYNKKGKLTGYSQLTGLSK